MDSDFQQQQRAHNYFQDIQNQYQQQKQHVNSGLTRYRSAPSSYLSSFLDTLPPNANSGYGGTSDLQHQPPPPPRPLSPETENILATFLSSIDGGTDGNINDPKPCDIPPQNQPDFTCRAVKQEMEPIQQQSDFNSSSSQVMYQRPSEPPPSWANQSNPTASNPAAIQQGGSFRADPYSTTAIDSMAQVKMSTATGGHDTSNNLVRQRSSPAGLFNDLNIDKSFGAGLVTQNSDFGQNIGTTGLDDRRFGTSLNRSSSSMAGATSYLTGYPINSWDESGSLEGSVDDDRKMVSDQENQKGETAANRPPLPLSHHLSLPKNALEKLMQFQDTTPMKIRAKRGCATHPRSIAERVRRTKISERMRKLQDLVPNMDKQTNTADMLDLAVDYIKDLQKQVKTLGNNRAKCTCSS